VLLRAVSATNQKMSLLAQRNKLAARVSKKQKESVPTHTESLQAQEKSLARHQHARADIRKTTKKERQKQAMDLLLLETILSKMTVNEVGKQQVI
jgi:hypothetical protein